MPRGPRHQPIDQPTTAPNQLARHLDHRRAEGRELHSQPRACSARCFAACRGVTGTSKALHAFRLQATDAITMYAPLLIRVSTGVVSARTPLFSCAIRFSWSHRSLA